MLLKISNINRYQCLIGGKKVKTIGNLMIHTGIIKKCGVNQDQQRVKYWASNPIVIHLHSAVTVHKLLSAEGRKYQSTQVAICFVLIFTRVHLVAVNFKVNLQAN